MAVTLADLTPYQRSKICDGCGGKTWRNLPQWHSRATCDAHDLAYWLGGDENDRSAADRGLLNGMIRDAAERPWWQQPWYRTMAWVYYLGVCNQGVNFFRYAAKRTLADVQRHFPDPVPADPSTPVA